MSNISFLPFPSHIFSHNFKITKSSLKEQSSNAEDFHSGLSDRMNVLPKSVWRTSQWLVVSSTECSWLHLNIKTSQFFIRCNGCFLSNSKQRAPLIEADEISDSTLLMAFLVNSLLIQQVKQETIFDMNTMKGKDFSGIDSHFVWVMLDH